MSNKKELPELTPKEIKDWIKSVEVFHPVSIITALSHDATLEQIEQAFYIERASLIGVGEELKERAKWDAWSVYKDKIDE